MFAAAMRPINTVVQIHFHGSDVRTSPPAATLTAALETIQLENIWNEKHLYRYALTKEEKPQHLICYLLGQTKRLSLAAIKQNLSFY